jgi:tetratricopeptide (TPR) repeat protein
MTSGNNSKRVLILVMSTLFIIGLGIAFLFYGNLNKKIDPRIVEARELYKKYDEYTQTGNFKAVLHLLDSIDAIYESVPHYSNSFERGVIENNKSALFLTMALHYPDSSLSLDGIHVFSKDSLLNKGKKHAELSVDIYENWLARYSNLNEKSITAKAKEDFYLGLEDYSQTEQEVFLADRTDEIQKAVSETERRLSVAYTNLGIVQRHTENYDSAIVLYKKALDLWDQNLTAENNINTLLGRPHKKQKLIERIFPPEK